MSKSRSIGNNDSKTNGWYNQKDKRNFNKPNKEYKPIGIDNYSLEKLSLTKDDILLIKTGNERISNDKMSRIAEGIRQKLGFKIPIIIAPDEIKFETIEVNELNNIILKLEEIRDSHWKNKLNGGN